MKLQSFVSIFLSMHQIFQRPCMIHPYTHMPRVYRQDNIWDKMKFKNGYSPIIFSDILQWFLGVGLNAMTNQLAIDVWV